VSSEITLDYNEFSPQDYLNEYYTEVSDENESLLQFFYDTYSKLEPVDSMLEVGGGPTIYQIISASRVAKHIDFSEYLPANLAMVRAWLDQKPGSFNWDIYFKRVLEIEGRPASRENIDALAGTVRGAVRRLTQYDVFREPPLVEGEPLYDIIASNFCIEGIQTDRQVFERQFGRMTSYLRPGGLLALCMVKNATYYRVGKRRFPVVPVNETIMENVLKNAGLTLTHIQSIKAVDPDQGYEGMLMIRATRG